MTRWMASWSSSACTRGSRSELPHPASASGNAAARTAAMTFDFMRVLPRVAGGELSGSGGLAQFFELLERHRALEAAQVVDEQHALEVVHLVLDAGGHQPLHLLLV